MRAAGVSRRTLQYSFNEVTGPAPLDFVRAVRMNGARLACCAPAPRIPWERWRRATAFTPPRFAAQYREFFGELPSQMLARPR